MALIGHDEAWRAWRSALRGERMHHAWLLSGQSGIGKAQFAQAAARELVGHVGGGDHHPDIITLERPPKDKKEADKKADGKSFETARNIKVDQIRDMQRALTTRPTLGDRRAIILDPADDMERGASNALLKSLEEPPAGTVFILVSHSPAKLLPTIRSRCRTLRFPSLSAEQMEALIADLAPDADPASRTAAIETAAGSPGIALRFLEFNLGDVAAIMRQIMDQGDAGFVTRGQLASMIGSRPAREQMRAVLDLAMALVADQAETMPAIQCNARIKAYEELVRLTGEVTTYNYDPGLLIMEIGTLLAGIGQASEPANV